MVPVHYVSLSGWTKYYREGRLEVRPADDWVHTAVFPNDPRTLAIAIREIGTAV